jgi:mono/diheme cytochrome c family protein
VTPTLNKFATVTALFLSLSLVAQTPEGNSTKGKELFLNYACYQCHGREGQGGAAGARLAPHLIGLEAFIDYVRHPSGQMPPVTAKVVSDAELADIHAFLKTIAEPKPVHDIALLNQTPGFYTTRSDQPVAASLPAGLGKEIVAAKCASCHALEAVTAARHTHEEWEKVVAVMLAKGATLTPDEVLLVAKYLSEHFGSAGTQAAHKTAAVPKTHR